MIASGEFPLTHPLARWLVAEDQLSVVLQQRWVTFDKDFDARELADFLGLLDGKTRIETISQMLGVEIESVQRLLQELMRLNVVTSVSFEFNASKDAAAVFLASRQNVSLDSARAHLRRAEVVISGKGTIAEELYRNLEGMSLGSLSTQMLGAIPSQEAFVIVAPSYAEVTEMSEINARFLERRVPWMQVLPHDGHAIAVGPVFVPNETACFDCYAKRRKANSLGNDPLLPQSPISFDDTLSASASASIAATIALDWIGSRNSGLPGRVSYLTYSSDGPKLTSAIVRRVPRCVSCSAINKKANVREWDLS